MNKREEKSNSSHANIRIQIYRFGNYISAVTTMIPIPHLRTSRIAAPENTRTRQQCVRLFFFWRRWFLFIYLRSFAPHDHRVLTHSLRLISCGYI